MISQNIIRPFVSAAVTVCLVSACLIASAQFASAKPIKAATKASGAQLLSRASLSFSKIPFEAERKKIKMQLSQIKDGQCETINMCQYRDTQNIIYNFWDEKENLVDKSLEASDFIGKPIAALNIGLARDKTSILKKVSLFLGDTKYKCRPEKETNREGTETGAILTSCTWILGEGWTFVRFNGKGQLIYAQVTSSQYV